MCKATRNEDIKYPALELELELDPEAEPEALPASLEEPDTEELPEPEALPGRLTAASPLQAQRETSRSRAGRAARRRRKYLRATA